MPLFRTILGIACLSVLMGCASVPDGAILAEEPASGAQEKTLRIAVIGDRTGGHRPGVFSNAMGKLELMDPDIVLSVGDQIEGYVADETEIRRQWDEVEQILEPFGDRFHAVPGNHDYANDVQARIWRERRGPPFWSFVQDGVLFVGLSTEDPPVKLPDYAIEGHRRLQEAMRRDPSATQQRILDASRARTDNPKPGEVAISDEQVNFVRQTLEKYPDSRWTFLIMHKPAWNYNNANFARIEQLLAGRSFTAIAGHEHYYGYDRRGERDFLTLSTTGGVWLKDGPGRVDHILWVTLRDGKPGFANIRIDGIFPKSGPIAD
ncbi:metallophosphoesterase family protein [Pontixanthobacter aquaemixtae]|uniref:Metallophosphoesterase n=1 Tax=Pontixanthobacter aquaemixtae TaxID=1958940 RepID=A0A844ZQE2_9SPHN|nr:metallophosphoesterase [Pontixanthobacter aquaemixtae]MXO89968.1 metallophosphoesterase [Pontixanthobacter aquaemixtae]